MTEKKWLGTWPANCQLHEDRYPGDNSSLDSFDFFVDGRFRERSDVWPYVRSNRWALMCPKCFADVGVGLGAGRGQKYDSKTLVKLEANNA